MVERVTKNGNLSYIIRVIIYSFFPFELDVNSFVNITLNITKKKCLFVFPNKGS